MQSSVPVSTVITSIFTTYRMFTVFGNIFLRYHGVKWQNLSILNSMIDNASILQHYKKRMLFIKALPQTYACEHIDNCGQSYYIKSNSRTIVKQSWW